MVALHLASSLGNRVGSRVLLCAQNLDKVTSCPSLFARSSIQTKANPSYPSRTLMTIHVQPADDLPDGLLVAQLETISYEALRDGCEVEASKLFNACCRDGIFYLDMAGTEPDILKAVDDIYALEQGIFELPEEELMQYDIDVLSPRKLNGSAVLQTILSSNAMVKGENKQVQTNRP